MNIGSKNSYPSCALSNFAPHPFELDGVEINSMEGFLQALKFSNFEVAKEVCKLVGYAAKKRGSKKNWQESGILHWNNKDIERLSDDYQVLLDRAYDALFENAGFKKALAAAKDATFSHTIGRTNPKETVLTQAEFCGQLNRLRNKL